MYIALNESVKPLDDVRVRKAMQLALNRPLILDAIYSGRGEIVNGIYPRGLYGYNESLEEIPYDPETAAKQMAESGHAGGFDLEVGVRATATQFETDLVRLVASMWSEIGIRTTVKVMTDEEFMDLRTSGRLPCYAAMWTADYNDPDNFVYTFFGNDRNTSFRSLNYKDKEVMKRVTDAKAIGDPQERLREYHALEKKIIQEDAAWIPLFTRQYVYVTSKRVTNLDASWNGSVKTRYRDITVGETE
jgi:ABC-type transport system substrate-binding protein